MKEGLGSRRQDFVASRQAISPLKTRNNIRPIWVLKVILAVFQNIQSICYFVHKFNILIRSTFNSVFFICTLYPRSDLALSNQLNFILVCDLASIRTSPGFSSILLENSVEFRTLITIVKCFTVQIPRSSCTSNKKLKQKH